MRKYKNKPKETEKHTLTNNNEVINKIISDLMHAKRETLFPKNYFILYDNGSVWNFNLNDVSFDYMNMWRDSLEVAVGYIYQYGGKGDGYSGRVFGPEGLIYLSGHKTLDQTVVDFWQRHKKAFEEYDKIQTDIFYYLERELRSHDWYYMMSDDGRVFDEGSKHMNLLDTLVQKCKQIHPERTKQLFLRYAPQQFDMFPYKD